MYRSVASALNPSLAGAVRNDFGVIIDRQQRELEEAAALSLRSRVATYMETHWDEFPTVLLEERALRLKGITGRAWGGEEELLALSKACGDIAVTVHQERGGQSDSFTYNGGGGAKQAEVHLRYTRDERRVALTGDVEAGGHYELLL